MRHRVKGRHLSRTAEHRKALSRNLITALLEHGRVRTTDAKAREIRPLAEKIVGLGKRGDLHARRQAVKVVGNGPALERLFGPIAERFANRPGGYTRLIKGGWRHGDGAPVAYVELLDETPRLVRAPAEGEGRERAKGKRGPADAATRSPRSEGARGARSAASVEEGRGARAESGRRGRGSGSSPANPETSRQAGGG